MFHLDVAWIFYQDKTAKCIVKNFDELLREVIMENSV